MARDTPGADLTEGGRRGPHRPPNRLGARGKVVSSEQLDLGQTCRCSLQVLKWSKPGTRQPSLGRCRSARCGAGRAQWREWRRRLTPVRAAQAPPRPGRSRSRLRTLSRGRSNRCQAEGSLDPMLPLSLSPSFSSDPSAPGATTLLGQATLRPSFASSPSSLSFALTHHTAIASPFEMKSTHARPRAHLKRAQRSPLGPVALLASALLALLASALLALSALAAPAGPLRLAAELSGFVDGLTADINALVTANFTHIIIGGGNCKSMPPTRHANGAGGVTIC